MDVLAKSIRGVAGVTTVALAVWLNAASAASATSTDNLVPTGTFSSYCNEGSPGNANPCQTDNAAVYYYMDSWNDYKLEAVDKAVVNSVMSEFGSDTQLTRHYAANPVFSGSGETDIVYEEGSVPGSDMGYTWCNDDSPGGYKCDQQYVRIEGGGGYSFGLTCHESGHAVGLTHGSQAYPVLSNGNPNLDCMMKPTYTTQHLGSNSIGNINNVY